MATRKKAKQTGKARGEDAIAYFERTTGKLTLARYLRAIRVGEEQTLEEFANILGVSKAHLSDVENGRRVVSVERAAAWAKLLGYDPGQFVELALQAELDAAGIKLKVSVKAA
jgi:transcriptional regulator with XRE-family HTH domain